MCFQCEYQGFMHLEYAFCIMKIEKQHKPYYSTVLYNTVFAMLLVFNFDLRAHSISIQPNEHNLIPASYRPKAGLNRREDER